MPIKNRFADLQPEIASYLEFDIHRSGIPDDFIVRNIVLSRG